MLQFTFEIFSEIFRKFARFFLKGETTIKATATITITIIKIIIGLHYEIL
jgi:hypothetical protein